MGRLGSLWLAALIWLLAAGAAMAADTTAMPAARPAPPPKAAAGKCLACHDQPHVTAVLAGPHGVAADPRTEATDDACASCHGPSLAHGRRVADGQSRPPPDLVFSGPRQSPPAELNATCNGCHAEGLRTHWQGSQHQAANLACSSCHQSHAAKDPMLMAQEQPKVCFTCHAEQRAQSLAPSHHPIGEGATACAQCHNPHGSLGPHLLTQTSVNETCFTCHADKRGPFLFEHAPVAEDCTTCHTPHGSAFTPLLVQRPPTLCQSCHDSSTHSSYPLSGNTLAGQPLASRQMLFRACLNCHTEVHGSNHPAGSERSR